MSEITVFISYSHDSDKHRQRVLGLSERLRAEGIPTILDRYVEKGSPPEGWPRWMMNGLDAATHVLCVCTETYYRRFRGWEVPGKGKGVDWEGLLVTQTFYDFHSRTNKFVPVLFESADDSHIPEPLRGQTHYLLESDDSGYQALYDALLAQSGVKPGPLGELRLKPRDTGQPLIVGGNLTSSVPAISPTSQAAGNVWQNKPDSSSAAVGIRADPVVTGIAMPQFASPFYLIVPGQSPAQIAQTCQPKPRLEELFEIITDPDEVPKALFRTEAGPKSKSALVPYQVDYVQGREGVTDIKDDITLGLSEAKGRLLICGAAGMGKTREVAEYARQRATRGWKICIALSEGDGRLGELAALPSELADAKLLVIIDNLHSRLLAGAESSPTYAQRVELFLSSLAKQVPENLQVIAMAHSESHFQREFNLDLSRANWQSFGVYQLPGFTLTGLQQMLTGLVAQAGVVVDEKDISKLVENSDRKPRTLFINVNLAFKNATALNGANWGPNEGDLWKESFLAVRGRHPTAGKVYAALRVLGDAGLPLRKRYVTALSGVMAGTDTTPAIEALVDKGLLGLRHGMLTAFSDEELLDLLQNDASLKLAEHWESVIGVVKDSPDRSPEWQADLVTLAFGLNRHQLPVRAEEVASFAIEQGAGPARAYIARAVTRFLRGNWSGSESDLTEAIERDPTDADAHFLRGATRNMLGDYPGMATDMDNAIQQGRTDSMVYASKGLAEYQQQKFGEAEVDFTTAMDAGKHDPVMFYLRGVARYQLKNFAGAEEDLTAALDQGLDIVRLMKPLEAIERGNVEQAIQGLDGPPPPPSHQDDALLHGLRGISRLEQAKYAEAETDLTLAIEHGFSACLARLGAMFQRTTLPGLASAREQFAQAQVQFGNDASLYFLRGLARDRQGKLPEAESDLDTALDAGFATQELYNLRGNVRARLARLADAEADFDLVIEKNPNDPSGYFLRGAVRFDQGNYAGADEDFTAAIQRGQDDSVVQILRGRTRLSQKKLADAESDFNRAIERSPHDAPAYSFRGVARFDQGNYAGAEEDFAAAMERGQADGTVYFLRGAARYHQQKLGEAESDLSLAIEKGKADGDSYALRAATRLDQGKHGEAEQDLNAAIERGRNDWGVYFGRGAARYNQKKFGEAEADLSIALEQGDRNIQIYSLRGASRLALEKWEGAEEDFSASIAGGRSDAGAYYGRGRARAGQGKFAEAEADFDTAVAGGMDDAETHVRRGQARSGQSKLNEAVEDFTTALARGPNDAFVHFLLGLTRFEQKQWAQAECDFDAAVAGNADFLPSYQERGRTRLIQDKMERAEQDFDYIIAREPKNVDAYHFRGLARYAQGNIAGAVSDYDTAIAERKSDAEILSNRVLAVVRLGRLDEAERDCARVMDLGVDSPAVQGCRGVLDVARGDFASALNRFQSADKVADSKDWYFWKGLAHLLSGQPDAARAAYRDGMAESVPGDVRIALGLFEFWIEKNKNYLVSDEALQAIAEIRSEMTHRLSA